MRGAHLYLKLLVTACLPLPSYADTLLPYWLSPTWVQSKVLDFHARNSEKYELAQQHSKQNTFLEKGGISTVPVATIQEPTPRKTSDVPVENAAPKINDKYLSKDELLELRKLLQKNHDK